MRFTDAVAGVGGFRLGMECAGHECVWANDWEYADFKWIKNKKTGKLERRGTRNSSGKVYQKHWNDGTYIDADIHTIDPDSIPDFDLLCAGFPCQSFSIAGKRGGFEDARGAIFYEICRIARAKRPQMLLLENVKGLLSADDRLAFKVILESLGELGYDVEWQVLNSKDFGVPQNRPRVFIVGHLGGLRGREVFPIQGDDGEDDKVAGEAEEGRQRMENQVASSLRGGDKWEQVVAEEKPMIYRHPMNYGKKSVYSPDEAHPSLRTVSRSPSTVRPCLTPDRMKKRQHGRRFKEDGEPMFTLTGQDIHGVEIIDDFYKNRDDRVYVETSPALRGERYGLKVANAVDPDGYLRYGHRWRDDKGKPQLVPIGWRRIRRATPREYERLQGFPDDWTRWGVDAKGNKVEISDTQRYRMMGNAVTVNVVEFLARRLMEVMS